MDAFARAFSAKLSTFPPRLLAEPLFFFIIDLISKRLDRRLEFFFPKEKSLPPVKDWTLDFLLFLFLKLKFLFLLLNLFLTIASVFALALGARARALERFFGSPNLWMNCACFF